MASARAPRILVRASATMGGELSALVERALDAAGIVACECSHLVLAVNAPGAARVPADEQPHRDVETHDRDLDAFVAQLSEDAARDRAIALADIAYDGGREVALCEALSRAGVVPLVHLSGTEALLVLEKALGALL